jgi:hypothetical protein
MPAVRLGTYLHILYEITFSRINEKSKIERLIEVPFTHSYWVHAYCLYHVNEFPNLFTHKRSFYSNCSLGGQGNHAVSFSTRLYVPKILQNGMVEPFSLFSSPTLQD